MEEVVAFTSIFQGIGFRTEAFVKELHACTMYHWGCYGRLHHGTNRSCNGSSESPVRQRIHQGRGTDAMAGGVKPHFEPWSIAKEAVAFLLLGCTHFVEHNSSNGISRRAKQAPCVVSAGC